MFWKLLKYEFKNVNRWYLAIYGAILVVSLGIGLFLMNMAQQIGLTGDISSRSETMHSASFSFVILLAMTFVGLMVALAISTLFLIIRRFKNSVYDRQGYLTLTLPITQHQILLSKLTGAVIWSLLSLLTLGLSIFLITAIIASSIGGIDWNLFFSSTFEYGNMGLLTLYILVNTISSTLLIYLSISIGQLFEDYRTALGILSYIVISIALGMISFHITPDSQFAFNLIYDIIFNLATSIIFYAGTYYILKNKVNLQ